MRGVIGVLCIGLLIGITSCKHKDPADSVTTVGDAITASGTLKLQSDTTYHYGTHVLVVNATTQFFLESTSVNLYPFNGMHIKITAVNTHYSAAGGPELYDVSSVVPY